MMQRQVDKFPYKKVLYLQWYQAAIANLILFKYLKQKYMNHIYFLISQQGILLKANNQNNLRTTQQQMNKFFTAKIQQLDISASSDFYQHIMQDIKQQTQKLKDSRDCPYINLVYSQKLKNSCLSLKKYGYSKPYQNWQKAQRQKRGFCYLIVRPQHRWKQIANNVMGLAKKRQGSQYKSSQKSWLVELNYQRFVWLYLRGQFGSLKKEVEVREKKEEAMVQVTFKKDITEYMELERTINQLKIKYSQECPNSKIKDKNKQSKLLILSTLELQKVTQLIYHQYGLPGLVRQLRSKNAKYLMIGPTQDINLQSISHQLKPAYTLREDIGPLRGQQGMAILLRLGHRHQLVSYGGMNYVMVRFDLPLKSNIQNMLKNRLPSLPRYFYYFQKDKSLYLLRRYQASKFKPALQGADPDMQIFLLNSLLLTLQQLHRRNIFIGSNFTQRIFVSGQLVVFEPGQSGNRSQDISRVVLLVRQWVKGLPKGQMKQELQRYDDPIDMLPYFEAYLMDNYV